MWDIYRHLVGHDRMEAYEDYARGFNLTNRMPLFVYPSSDGKEKKGLSVSDVMAVMRTRLEDTWFDPRGVHRADVGAGSGHSAYRWRPLIWHSSAASNHDDAVSVDVEVPYGADVEATPSDATPEFVNERTVATQQTAWNFVAASRPWLPAPIAAIQWWAPDDSATSLRVPIYGGATRVPYHFADSVGQEPAAAVAPSEAPTSDAINPSLDSAFWVWNLVSNLAYGERADIVSRALNAKLLPMQQRLMVAAAKQDADLAAAAAMGKQSDSSAAQDDITERATTFCEVAADGAFHAWQAGSHARTVPVHIQGTLYRYVCTMRLIETIHVGCRMSSTFVSIYRWAGVEPSECKNMCDEWTIRLRRGSGGGGCSSIFSPSPATGSPSGRTRRCRSASARRGRGAHRASFRSCSSRATNRVGTIASPPTEKTRRDTERRLFGDLHRRPGRLRLRLLPPPRRQPSVVRTRRWALTRCTSGCG